MGKCRRSDTQRTQILYRKSNYTFNTISRSITNCSEYISRRGHLERDISCYTDDTKKDLCIETEHCKLRRYIKKRKHETIQFNSKNNIEDNKIYLFMDNEKDSVHAINVEDMLVSNVKRLLADCINSYLNPARADVTILEENIVEKAISSSTFSKNTNERTESNKIETVDEKLRSDLSYLTMPMKLKVVSGLSLYVSQDQEVNEKSDVKSRGNLMFCIGEASNVKDSHVKIYGANKLTMSKMKVVHKVRHQKSRRKKKRHRKKSEYYYVIKKTETNSRIDYSKKRLQVVQIPILIESLYEAENNKSRNCDTGLIENVCQNTNSVSEMIIIDREDTNIPTNTLSIEQTGTSNVQLNEIVSHKLTEENKSTKKYITKTNNLRRASIQKKDSNCCDFFNNLQNFINNESNQKNTNVKLDIHVNFCNERDNQSRIPTEESAVNAHYQANKEFLQRIKDKTRTPQTEPNIITILDTESRSKLNKKPDDVNIKSDKSEIISRLKELKEVIQGLTKVTDRFMSIQMHELSEGKSARIVTGNSINDREKKVKTDDISVVESHNSEIQFTKSNSYKITESEKIIRVTDMTITELGSAESSWSINMNKPKNIPKPKSLFNQKNKLIAYYYGGLTNSFRSHQPDNTIESLEDKNDNADKKVSKIFNYFGPAYKFLNDLEAQTSYSPLKIKFYILLFIAACVIVTGLSLAWYFMFYFEEENGKLVTPKVNSDQSLIYQLGF